MNELQAVQRLLELRGERRMLGQQSGAIGLPACLKVGQALVQQPGQVGEAALHRVVALGLTRPAICSLRALLVWCFHARVSRQTGDVANPVRQRATNLPA